MTSYLLRTLFVHTPGTRLVLDADSVKALREGAPPIRLPLNAIDSIVVCGGVDVSTSLLIRCAQDGKTLAFLSMYGKPRALVEGSINNHGGLRKEQYRNHFDEEKRTMFARSIVQGKIDQMSWGIKQWARDMPSAQAKVFRDKADSIEALKSAITTATRQECLGIEGTATKQYFSALGQALRGYEWRGRTRRPPLDPVNAALSFLYGISRIAVHGGLHAAGLDPYTGFLHGDKSDQPSLVLDLLEEFRPTADRVVVTLFNRKQLSDKHFTTSISNAVSLNEEGRGIIMDAWYKHRCKEAHVQGSVQPIPNAAIPIVQANKFANCIRHGTVYEPHRLAVI